MSTDLAAIPHDECLSFLSASTPVGSPSLWMGRVILTVPDEGSGMKGDSEVLPMQPQCALAAILPAGAA